MPAVRDVHPRGAGGRDPRPDRRERRRQVDADEHGRRRRRARPPGAWPGGGEPYAPATPRRRHRPRHRLHPPGTQPLHQPLDRRERLHRRLPAPPRPDRPAARIAETDPARCSSASSSTMRPDTIVGELAPGERQLVEIAKALHRSADLIILDEPTTSLTPRETARLFDVIARLRAEGRHAHLHHPHPRRRGAALRPTSPSSATAASSTPAPPPTSPSRG